MKTLIFMIAVCVGSVASAEPLEKASPVKNTVLSADKKERRLALEEMRSRAQLNMLVDKILDEGDELELHGWGYDRVLASSRRK